MKQYPKYRESGIQWIGQVPEHWEVSKLKYVIESLKSGGTPDSGNTSFYVEGGTPWVSIGDMSASEHVKTTQKTLSKEGIANKNLIVFPAGTILYSIYATLGKVSELDVPACINQAILAIEPKDCILKPFFKYSLISQEQYVYSIATNSTQPNLNAEKVSNFAILLPPLSEQEAIAAYLDKQTGKIDKSIESLEQQKTDLQQYRTSLISEAVTHGLSPNTTLKDSGVQWIGQIPEEWKVGPLKYYTSQDKYAIKTGPFGSQLKGDELRENGDVRVYNQRNVIDAQFETVQNYVTSNKAEELESFFTRPSDILLTSRGTIGRAAILPDSAIMGILHPCLIAVRLNTDLLDKRYFLHVLSSPLFRTYVSVESNATTIEVIYTETLKSFILPIPPLPEQEAIAAYLDERMGKIDTAIATIDRQIADLRAYRTALITEAVTGKVDVRVSV